MRAIAFTRHERASGRARAATRHPVVCAFNRQPRLTSRVELTLAHAADDVFVLSGPRRLALCALLGIGLLLLIAPPVLAAWSVLDSTALDRTMAQFEQVSHIAVLAPLGRFALSLVLAVWLAKSPKEQ